MRLQHSAPPSASVTFAGPTSQTNYCLWPAFNVLNFRFVPLRFQVLATTCMATVWNGLLSHIARPKGEAKQQASEI